MRLTGIVSARFAARPIIDPEIQGIGAITRPAWAAAVLRDPPQRRIPRLTHALFGIPHNPLQPAPLLAPAHLNEFMKKEDTNGKA
ncbi:hypothetical protein H4C48_25980 [Pseudomonas asiatica]|uniref:hypothetical protein n=1 Tax=Pseudomonas asiatica TaxID=2219225 RepID=UPI0015FD044B|nr:hypothetical protein [Pseudomonas asiatica]MBA6113814.1 hypothetical protein [Pseudomonas asiatica]